MYTYFYIIIIIICYIIPNNIIVFLLLLTIFRVITIGLEIDGWKGNDRTYYCAVFGIWPRRSLGEVLLKKQLLAVGPLLDEASHSAESHSDYIKATLECYNKTISDLQFLISDNCSTMQKLASDFLLCGFLGCYAHKLNLAVKKW
jgi:hypothetical protein